MPSGHRPQPPVGKARVAISGSGAAGNPWVNVFWLALASDTPTIGDFTDTLSSMVDDYVTRFGGYISTAYVIEQVKGAWMVDVGSVIESVVAVSHTGSGSSSYSTDATCTLINWSISDYYRGGHPRTYLPGTPEPAISDGRNLGSSFRSNLATAADDFIADINALALGTITETVLGTVRFASGNSWLHPPVFRPYNAASVSPVVATQRRRLSR
jgi:hypothetical protein